MIRNPSSPSGRISFRSGLALPNAACVIIKESSSEKTNPLMTDGFKGSGVTVLVGVSVGTFVGVLVVVGVGTAVEVFSAVSVASSGLTSVSFVISGKQADNTLATPPILKSYQKFSPIFIDAFLYAKDIVSHNFNDAPKPITFHTFCHNQYPIFPYSGKNYSSLQSLFTAVMFFIVSKTLSDIGKSQSFIPIG